MRVNAVTIDGPRILTIDIETFPNLGWVWGLWKQDISIKQLRESAYTGCFGAKWHDQDRVMFYSIFHHGKAKMLDKAHELMSEADILVHYNGDDFDVPHLNTEMVLAGYPEPAPSSNVDLLKAVRKKFRFPSNKLEYVAPALGVGEKLEHEGFELWIKCMAGDAKAWSRMRQYCKRDVVIEEKLHDRILGWIPNYPSAGLYYDDDGTRRCGNCGSDHLQSRGYAYTKLRKYQRYMCMDCNRWHRDTHMTRGVKVVGVES